MPFSAEERAEIAIELMQELAKRFNGSPDELYRIWVSMSGEMQDKILDLGYSQRFSLCLSEDAQTFLKSVV